MKIAKKALILAYKKGYRSDSLGNIYGMKNFKLKLGINQGYKYFNVRCIGGSESIMVHRFIGYEIWKDRIFDNVIRHLDGNSTNNRIENLAIGTHSDNMMDIPRNIRQKKAKYAAKKYSDELINTLRIEYGEGNSYNKLSKKYSIHKSVLSYYLSKTAKRREVIIERGA